MVFYYHLRMEIMRSSLTIHVYPKDDYCKKVILEQNMQFY